VSNIDHTHHRATVIVGLLSKIQSIQGCRMGQDQGNTQFQHRQNEDASFDSICRRCFATVASRTHEGQFAEHEDSHQCSPIRLFAIADGAVPESQNRIGDTQRVDAV
jgi:hypothetical protein